MLYLFLGKKIVRGKLSMLQAKMRGFSVMGLWALILITHTVEKTWTLPIGAQIANGTVITKTDDLTTRIKQSETTHSSDGMCKCPGGQCSAMCAHPTNLESDVTARLKRALEDMGVTRKHVLANDTKDGELTESRLNSTPSLITTSDLPKRVDMMEDVTTGTPANKTASTDESSASVETHIMQVPRDARGLAPQDITADKIEEAEANTFNSAEVDDDNGEEQEYLKSEEKNRFETILDRDKRLYLRSIQDEPIRGQNDRNTAQNTPDTLPSNILQTEQYKEEVEEVPDISLVQENGEINLYRQKRQIVTPQATVEPAKAPPRVNNFTLEGGLQEQTRPVETVNHQKTEKQVALMNTTTEIKGYETTVGITEMEKTTRKEIIENHPVGPTVDEAGITSGASTPQQSKMLTADDGNFAALSNQTEMSTIQDDPGTLKSFNNSMSEKVNDTVPEGVLPVTDIPRLNQSSDEPVSTLAAKNASSLEKEANSPINIDDEIARGMPHRPAIKHRTYLHNIDTSSQASDEAKTTEKAQTEKWGMDPNEQAQYWQEERRLGDDEINKQDIPDFSNLDIRTLGGNQLDIEPVDIHNFDPNSLSHEVRNLDDEIKIREQSKRDETGAAISFSSTLSATARLLFFVCILMY